MTRTLDYRGIAEATLAYSRAVNNRQKSDEAIPDAIRAYLETAADDTVTPEMIAAGMRVLNQHRVRLGPGPCLKDAYMAMRAARKP